MRSPQELVDEIVRRTGLPQERILQLIQEKKQKVGGGFLSDAGATYLVAADLGVQIAPTPSSELTLNQLSVGLNEVTTVGRVLSMVPLRTYRKKDNTSGVYRRILIYDQTSGTSVTLWDERARLIDTLGLKRGDVVRVVKAYARPDLDMKPVLHVGNRGSIEIVKNESVEKNIPTVDVVALDLGEVDKESFIPAVKGKVVSPPSEMNYVRRDGTPSSLVSFRAAGMNGGLARRIVIWGKNAKSPPVSEVKVNDPFLLTSVKVKTLPHGELEFHASDGSDLILSGPELGVTQVRRLFRVLSVGPREAEGPADLIVAGEDRKVLTTRIREALDLLQSLRVGDVIAHEGEHGISHQGVLEKVEKLGKVKAYEPGIDKLPTLDSFFRKIASLKFDANPVFLQAMALSRGAIQQLDTKRGERVSKGELIVGDDTGEIMLTAWRSQANMFNGIVPGEKLWILGFVPKQSYTGLVLEAKAYSSIVQLRLRTQSS